MAKPKLFVVCPECGAHLDSGECCDCQRIEISPEDIPKEQLRLLARPVLAAVRAAFEDPTVAAEFAAWSAARQGQKEKAAPAGTGSDLTKNNR